MNGKRQALEKNVLQMPFLPGHAFTNPLALPESPALWMVFIYSFSPRACLNSMNSS